MLVRVRSESGTHRATNLDEATAHASHVVDALRHCQPALFPEQEQSSFALYFDPKFERPVDADLPLTVQAISHGTLLYARACWACDCCTFLNLGTKNSESVCEVCETPAATTNDNKKRPLEQDEIEEQEKRKNMEEQLRQKIIETTRSF